MKVPRTVYLSAIQKTEAMVEFYLEKATQYDCQLFAELAWQEQESAYDLRRKMEEQKEQSEN